MAQFDLSSIYTSDKYTSVLDLLKKLINNIDGVQYVAEDQFSSLSSSVSGHTASITTLNTNYNALNSSVSGHTTSIDTLNTNVGKNTTDIGNLKTTVSNITNNTYYTHNICILINSTGTIKVNLSISMLSTTDNKYDAQTLADALTIMLRDDKYLNCLCLYKGPDKNDIYTSITFSDGRITLMSDPTTSSPIAFDLEGATITDSVIPIV